MSHVVDVSVVWKFSIGGRWGPEITWLQMLDNLVKLSSSCITWWRPTSNLWLTIWGTQIYCQKIDLDNNWKIKITSIVKNMFSSLFIQRQRLKPLAKVTCWHIATTKYEKKCALCINMLERNLDYCMENLKAAVWEVSIAKRVWLKEKPRRGASIHDKVALLGRQPTINLTSW